MKLYPGYFKLNLRPLIQTNSKVIFAILLFGLTSSTFAARYEYNAIVKNESGGPLRFLWYSKGTDDNPAGHGAERGHLYHGEMSEVPDYIPEGAEVVYKAKSVGSTIQGTLVFEMSNGQLTWVYFHVPDIRSRHSQARNIDVAITLDGDHAFTHYTVNKPKTKVKFLSYNTHLFKDSLASTANDLIGNPSLVWDDSARREAIVQSVRELDPDVVALQEVWANSMKDWFVKQLKTDYPYNYAPHSLQTLKISNGLVLLSKFRLTNLGNHLFSTLTGVNLNDPLKYLEVANYGDDWWSEKGYLTANLVLMDTQYHAYDSRIGISHTSTQVESVDFSNISEFVVGTVFGGSHWHCCLPSTSFVYEVGHDQPFNVAIPAFLMGDLNTHIDNYEDMNQVFNTAHAYDVWVDLHGEVTHDNVLESNAYTVYNAENSLVQIYDPKTNGPDRIDYFYMKQGSSEEVLSVQPQAIYVDYDNFQYSDQTDESDHWPLIAEFDLV